MWLWRGVNRVCGVISVCASLCNYHKDFVFEHSLTTLTYPHTHILTTLTHTAAVVGFTQETYTAFEGVQGAQEVTVAVLEGTLGTNFSFNVQSRPGGTATGE